MSVTYSVVQIQAFRIQRLDHALAYDLYSMVPSHSHWDELTEWLPEKKESGILTPHEDIYLIEDVTALSFSSVGDWAGYGSWFEHEVDMTSIFEVVEPFREDIMSDIEKEFALPRALSLRSEKNTQCSILTLWTGYSSYDSYSGEYDFDFYYNGVLKNLRAAL